MSDIIGSGETVLDMATGKPFVSKATDPVMANVATPGDFTGQYPQPLDPTEILAMCEEITAWQAIPEHRTSLKQELWREISSLSMYSGTTADPNQIAFTDGACPEEYAHSGSNSYVDLKNIGAKKSLTLSDIMHSAAVAASNWSGINTLIGGAASGEGLPGASNANTFLREHVADLKEKEIRLGMTLVMGGWDRLLVLGNAVTRPLEFTGIENWFNTNCTGSYHSNSNAASGTFTGAGFDRFLAEACAKPTHLFGHPSAIQEIMAAYFAIGFNGSQIIGFPDGNRVVPGYNFAGFVNTAIGRLAVVADNNFTRTNSGGGGFQTNIYALRMTHNGEDLVYKITQIPLALKDLVPGCTAIAFEIWAKTALVVKWCCAHGVYTNLFTGRVNGVTQCTSIG